MQTRTCYTNLLLALLCFSLALILVSKAAGAQDGSEAARRQWPSQTLPEQPVNARICSCLYAGENVPIGETICMKYQGRQVLATCDTVVNNPSWSISSKACPPS